MTGGQAFSVCTRKLSKLTRRSDRRGQARNPSHTAEAQQQPKLRGEGNEVNAVPHSATWYGACICWRVLQPKCCRYPSTTPNWCACIHVYPSGTNSYPAGVEIRYTLPSACRTVKSRGMRVYMHSAFVCARRSFCVSKPMPLIPWRHTLYTRSGSTARTAVHRNPHTAYRYRSARPRVGCRHGDRRQANAAYAGTYSTNGRGHTPGLGSGVCRKTERETLLLL